MLKFVFLTFGSMFGLSFTVVALLVPAMAAATSNGQADFGQLLAESGLEFSMPAGFEEIPLTPNSLLQHERAIRSKVGNLEVRYVIRPIGRVEIAYDDPHSAAPQPNDLFAMLFDTLTIRLSGGGHAPDNRYPPEQARDLFNAHWASASVFDVVPELTRDFSQALLVAIHKNDLADAYVIYLFDDYEQVKGLIKSAMSSLGFLR